VEKSFGLSHLSPLAAGSELAPLFAFANWLPGFDGPFPPPLWMKAIFGSDSDAIRGCVGCQAIAALWNSLWNLLW
jgi:hypothetical protein